LLDANRATFLLAFFLLIGADILVAEQNDFETRYQLALQHARSGDLLTSLPVLAELVRVRPETLRFRYDYIQVLSWANRYNEVLKHSQEITIEESPIYVLMAIAGALRHEKQFTKAEKIYRIILSRTPGDISAQVALSLVYIDQTHTKDALDILQTLEKEHPENISILVALAYANNADKDYLGAFSYYERVLSIDPQHRESLKGSVFAINALGANQLAIERASMHREVFSDDEWAKLQWDASATLVRWGEVAPEEAGQQFNETDSAIRSIHENLQAKNRLILQDPELWSARARFDLIVALRDRRHMQDVVDQFRILQEQGVKLPAYVEIAAGDAFLYLQKPVMARELYLSALKKDSNNYQARLSLVYAYVEAEQYNEAFQTATEIAAEQPEKLQFQNPEGLVYTRGNPQKTQAELTAVLTKAFADDLDYAQPRLEDLHNNAPFNPNIGNELANLFYYRGWPRRAKERYVSSMNIDSQHLGLKTGYARTTLELREYLETEKKTYELGLRYPENKGVQRALRRWDIHNMREFKIFSNGGFNSGSVQGSEEVNLDSFLYSQPLNYNYRLFSHVRWQTALFNEGRGFNTRYGLGLEYRRPNLTVASELHYDNSTTNALGFAANIDYQFDDFWQLAAGIDGRSGETPLRALNDGVTANSAYMRLGYRFHESRRLDLSAQVLSFSDNNFRSMIGGNYFERWYSGSIYKFATILGAGYSHNSKGSTPSDPGIGAIYFNPKNDNYFSLTLDNDWLTYRFYDLVFKQRVAVTAGSYWQDGYGASAVGNVLYEHRWQLPRDLLEFNYGAVRYTRVYDGDRENGWNFHLNLNLRF
jgi:biofilm PGA synthesis protein PgaA